MNLETTRLHDLKQLLEIAPPDDPYYERARRKLSRYVTKEELPR